MKKIQFVEHDDERNLIVAVNSVVDQPRGEASAAKIATRAILPLPSHGSLDATFTKANAIVNRALFKLVNPEELRRIGVQEAIT